MQVYPGDTINFYGYPTWQPLGTATVAAAPVSVPFPGNIPAGTTDQLLLSGPQFSTENTYQVRAPIGQGPPASPPPVGPVPCRAPHTRPPPRQAAPRGTISSRSAPRLVRASPLAAPLPQRGARSARMRRP